MANIGKAVKLGVFTLAIMNVTAVVSLRGLPAEAVYGLSSAFYYLFAAIVFLIPTSLVAAELAAMFQDKQGGVFRWVGEAYGKKWGFLAIWVQWIESTIWYPTVLTFGAVSIAFIGMNDAHDMTLASNKMYTLVVVLIIYWLATFISLKGLSWVGKVAKVGGIVGTIIPAALLIILGITHLIIFLQIQNIRLGIKFLPRTIIKPIMLQFLRIHFYPGRQGMFFMDIPGIIQWRSYIR